MPSAYEPVGENRIRTVIGYADDAYLLNEGPLYAVTKTADWAMQAHELGLLEVEIPFNQIYDIPASVLAAREAALEALKASDVLIGELIAAGWAKVDF